MKIECASAANIQYHCVIHFLILKNVTTNKIHKHLTAVYGSEVMSIQAMSKWCHQFKNGRTSVFDEAGLDNQSVC